MTEENQFFHRLLEATKQQYNESREDLRNKHWYYSVCGTPIQKNKGIVLGINWGVSKNYKHEPQSIMPDGKEILDDNFIRRSKEFLIKHLLLDFDKINFNYTNLCFFRTSNASCLELKDYKNSLLLFKQFVDFVNPPWIFSLGNVNYQKLFQLRHLTNVKEYFDHKRKHKGIKTKLWGTDFYSVPHPNAHLTTESRNKIWEVIGEQFASSQYSNLTSTIEY